MNRGKMSLGSLFDGSGGFPLAGVLCGIVPKWASEIEPYPIAVTKSRFPNMKHLGDIAKINGGQIEPVDVITFGSPCQDLSVAGKRAGLKHEANGDKETTRSGLFMEAVRIIKEMRGATNGKYPSFALWENVPGAFSSNKGEDFRIVCEELIKIVEPAAVMPEVPKNGWPYADSYSGDGWSLAYRVFDAQYWGVPQRRRRIHLVLDLRGERAREVLFEREGLSGYFAQGGTPWESLAADAQNCVGADDRAGERTAVAYTLKIRSGCEGCGKGALMHSTATCYSIENPPADSRVDIDKSGKVQTLTSRMGTGGGNVPMIMEPVVYESHPMDSRVKETGEVSPTVSAKWHKGAADTHLVCEGKPVYCLQGNGIDRADTAGCNGKGWNENACYTLNTIDRPAVAYSQQAYDEFIENTISCTLKHHGGTYGGGSETLIQESSPSRYIVRRFTPTECARLQGFPDNWGHTDVKKELTDEEYAFWTEVRCTYAVVNGKEPLTYRRDQMLTWYNKLHTDSAEYKMWGNGIALPPALYCMQGIAKALAEGDGGVDRDE